MKTIRMGVLYIRFVTNGLQMKINVKTILILTGCLLLPIMIWLWLHKRADIIPLPNEYKDYQLLNVDFHSDNHKARLLTTSYFWGSLTSPIEVRSSINNTSIAYVAHEYVTTYYKIDADGNIIDSLECASNYPGFLDEFCVFDEPGEKPYYTLWPLNGDTTSHSFIEWNKNLSWSERKLDIAYKDIRQNARYFFFDLEHHPNPEDDARSWVMKKLYFYKDRKWQVLYRKSDEAYEDEEKEIEDFKNVFYRTREEGDNEESNQFFTSQSYVIRYFEKKEYITYVHRISGNEGERRTVGWLGTLYVDIPLKGGTLHIKEDDMIIEQEEGYNKTALYHLLGDGETVSRVSLNIYTGVALNYTLYSTSLDTLYIIQKR